MMEGFTVTLSEKTNEEAIKEVALKVKSVFPKLISYIVILFTPHYLPSAILKTINLTLKPQAILGIQAPLLIFEDKVIEKGIVACAFNKRELQLKDIFIKKDDPQNIERALRMAMKDLAKDNQFLFSILGPSFNPFNYLRGVTLSLGRAFNAFGAGYIRRYGHKNFQIINNKIDEGLTGILGKGFKVSSLKIGGFLPLGKPFMINRIISKEGIIMEINGEPAINIYKNYLEEKFEVFRKKSLLSLYPLGIKEGNSFQLISVLDYLDDGSLLCLGQIKEKVEGHLMIFHSPGLFESLKNILEPIKEKEAGFIFMINSLIRKRILKSAALEEIKLIKHHLGEKFKVTGIFSDYSLFADKEKREIALGAANLLLTLWE